MNNDYLKEHNKTEIDDIQYFSEPIGYQFGPTVGEYFGVDVSKNPFKLIYPEGFSGEKNDAMKDKMEFSFIEEEKILNYEEQIIPLIFKYKGNNIGVELLTGIEVRFVDPISENKEEHKTLADKIIDINDDDIPRIGIEEFQEKLPEARKHPLIIVKDKCYAVDDEFKMIYAKFVRKHKDDLVKDLLKLNENSIENFGEHFDELVDMCKDVAYTENIIFDNENANGPSM